VLLLGSGATKCKEVIDNQNLDCATNLVPSAEQMSQLSFKKYENDDFEDVAYFEPYYLKDFILQTSKKNVRS